MTGTPLAEVTERVDTWDPRRRPDETFEYLDLSCVDNEMKVVSTSVSTLGAGAPSRARQLIVGGDVLVSTVRPNLNAVAVVPQELHGATASTGFTVLRPTRQLDSRYLFHWVRSRGFVDDMVSRATGASYPAVSDRIVKQSRLPLPTLGEQRRIATILDSADAVRRRRSRAVSCLSSLVSSVFVAMFGQPMATTRWPTRQLGEVARIVRGASPRPAGDPRYFGGDIPWLKIADLSNEPGPIVRDIREGVTEAGRDRSVLLPPGTLVLTNSATVGVPKIVEPSTCIHDGFLAFLDLSDDVNKFWLCSALALSRPRLISLAPEGTQKNLNTPIVKSVEMAVPPPRLQQEYADRMTAISAEVDRSEQAMSTMTRLFTSLQARAFRGEL